MPSLDPLLRRLPVRFRRALWLLPLLALQIGCDQGAKVLASDHLQGQPPTTYLGGSVKLVYAENPGAFLGLFRTLPDSARFWLLVLGVGLGLLAGLLFLLGRRGLRVPALLAGVTVLAGGVGNFIDRVINDGRVVDFLQVGVGPLKTGIFNIADVQIMAGAFALAWLIHRARPADEGPPPLPS